MRRGALTREQAMRYSRHIMLPGFDLDKQEVLCDSSVIVFGVGGLGCAVAQYLVASGIGRLTLVDDDVVDRSNLQRQVLHREASVGMLKTESALAALQALNSECEIETLSHRLDYDQMVTTLTDYTVLVDCTDNLASRLLLNSVAWQLKKPLVSGAAIRTEGQIFTVLPMSNSACYACYAKHFSEQQLTCSEAGVLSPLVGVIGAMQALETLKVITGYGKTLHNQLVLFDGIDLSQRIFNVQKNSQCEVCAR